MDVELRALEDNRTWELTYLPPGKKAIRLHLVFKTKLKVDGTVDRKKARLIVQGNRQKYGVDYQETFALVAKMVTVNTNIKKLLPLHDGASADVIGARAGWAGAIAPSHQPRVLNPLKRKLMSDL
ncbi:retrovirus-related pol polyprotein from transposon TNT 1-94 [Tanacetum coccineum]|uniref:Retrovirus-related pol polyprotein from transposon TNT 1-94 n=1 Tax=Tanacetum coccineum TaxID=301880 RepID=A0ABQ5DK27_9ASTR